MCVKLKLHFLEQRANFIFSSLDNKSPIQMCIPAAGHLREERGTT